MISVALLAVALSFSRLTRFRRPPRRGSSEVDVLQLALLLRIGLSSGLSLVGTFELAAPHVDRETGDVLRAVGRQGLASGLTSALLRHGGQPRRLFRVLADAHLSGAPMVYAVNTFINDELERKRAAALHRARVLPVRLTLPVALGLLPGFVLLGVAPQIVLALQDLLGQVAGL